MQVYREIPVQKQEMDSQHWIKGMGNNDPYNHEFGDICTGILQGMYFTGMYTGGSLTSLGSFMIMDSYALVM